MEFNAPQQCVSKYEKGFLALPLIDSDFLWTSMNNITIFQLAINRGGEIKDHHVWLLYNT